MSERERPATTGTVAPPGQRWFISAPVGMDLRPLLAGLQRRGAAPYVLSDVARLGADISENLQEAIATADSVLVVLAADRPSLNCAFEAGMAVGIGKPVVVVTDPDAAVPSDFGGFLVVRARPDDLDAINFALDQAERHPAISARVAAATGKALGPRTDQLLDRAARILTLTGPAAIEQAATELLIEAIEDSGAVAVKSPGPDHRFDLGVWSDDLGAIAANPLLIELKRSFRRETVQQAAAALRATSSARVALIVYLDPASPGPGELQAAFPVLAISLPELLGQMRGASVAEVVRQLRNRSVHGLPTP